MSGRFAVPAGIAWVIIAASSLMLLIGLISLFPSETSNPFESTVHMTLALSLIGYGLFGILVSGAVQVLIAIYEQLVAANAASAGDAPAAAPADALSM